MSLLTTWSLFVCVWFQRTGFISSEAAIFHHTVRASDFACVDPYLGGTRELDRKWMVMGLVEDGTGLGNLLLFFPAAYYFAAFTNREIVLLDDSNIGLFCQVIKCGFPTVSEAKPVFEEDLSEKEMTYLKRMSWRHFDSHISGEMNFSHYTQVGPYGFQSKSDWWAYNSICVECVARMTGCSYGDVSCAERHAYQRFLLGPMLANVSSIVEPRLHGFSAKFRRGLFTLPHHFMPRIDLSIHLRAQFYHFEGNNQNASWSIQFQLFHQLSLIPLSLVLAVNNTSDPLYQEEVAAWINSSERNFLVAALKEKILGLIHTSRKDIDMTNTTVPTNTNTATSGSVGGVKYINGQPKVIEPFYIYVASDNEVVKKHFAQVLGNDVPEFMGYVQVVTKDSDTVIHSKFLYDKKASRQQKMAVMRRPMIDLAFDFYVLSLSNHIISWKKGYGLSTFVHSAQKVSGTKERTNHGTWGGIGTKGFQIRRNENKKPNPMFFEKFSTYPNFDKPNDPSTTTKP